VSTCSADEEASVDIYGVDSPGPRVRVALMVGHFRKRVFPTSPLTRILQEMLRSRLDAMVANCLSTVLSRNPKLRLTSEDADFLRRDGNVLEVGLSVPKQLDLAPLHGYLCRGVTDGTSFYRLKYSPGVEPIRSSEERGRVFLFNERSNHTGEMSGLGMVEISCQIAKSNEEQDVDHSPFKLDDVKKTDVESGHFKIRISSHGKLDEEKVLKGLIRCAKTACWERHLDRILEDKSMLRKATLVLKDGRRLTSRYRRLSPKMFSVVEEWLPLGIKEKVPSVQSYVALLPPNMELLQVLDQLTESMNKVMEPTKVHRMSKNGDSYVKGLSVETFERAEVQFALIAEFDSQANEKIIRMKRVSCAPICGGKDDPTAAERRCLFVVKVGPTEVQAFSYNVCREIADAFRKECAQILSWLAARALMSNDLALQRKGLFQRQYCIKRVETPHTTPQGKAGEPTVLQLQHYNHTTRMHQLLAKNEKHPGRKEVAEAAAASEGSITFAPFCYRNVTATKECESSLVEEGAAAMLALEESAPHLRLQRVLRLWEERGGADVVKLPGLQYILDNSALLEESHTPLLLLGDWRRKALDYKHEKEFYHFENEQAWKQLCRQNHTANC